jgi:hypothetical protein
MVRLFCALSALLVAATVLWLSVRGAESLWLITHAHPLPRLHVHRFALLVSMFAGSFGAFFPIMIAMKNRRSNIDEDVSLTPRVRRLPSGLREL